MVLWAVLVVAGGGATWWLEEAGGPGPDGQRPGVVGPESGPSPAVVSSDVRVCPDPSRPPSAGDPVRDRCSAPEQRAPVP